MQIKIKKPTKGELEKLGIEKWDIWEKEVSEFDWFYDSQETCYLYEGDVEVKTKDGKVHFGPGDLVVFPKGLKCVWKVNKPVRKRYKFD